CATRSPWCQNWPSRSRRRPMVRKRSSSSGGIAGASLMIQCASGRRGGTRSRVELEARDPVLGRELLFLELRVLAALGGGQGELGVHRLQPPIEAAVFVEQGREQIGRRTN